MCWAVGSVCNDTFTKLQTYTKAEYHNMLPLYASSMASSVKCWSPSRLGAQDSAGVSFQGHETDSVFPQHSGRLSDPKLA